MDLALSVTGLRVTGLRARDTVALRVAGTHYPVTRARQLFSLKLDTPGVPTERSIHISNELRIARCIDHSLQVAWLRATRSHIGQSAPPSILLVALTLAHLLDLQHALRPKVDGCCSYWHAHELYQPSYWFSKWTNRQFAREELYVSFVRKDGRNWEMEAWIKVLRL